MKKSVKKLKNLKKLEKSLEDGISKTMPVQIHLENLLGKKQRTFGQKAADVLTKWAGSWTFILSFSTFLILWIIVNTTWIVFGQTWDIYPFILLNLVLSCLAALQAPIILMSQNRAGQKDRIRVEYDYAVNRKAEKEIQQIQKDLELIKKKFKIRK